MTTIEFDRLTGGFTEQSRGWTVSVLLHGVAIAGTVLLMARVDQPVPVDLFQWNVSMVDAEKPAQSSQRSLSLRRIGRYSNDSCVQATEECRDIIQTRRIQENRSLTLRSQ